MNSSESEKSSLPSFANLIDDNLIEKTLSFAKVPGGELLNSSNLRGFITGSSEAVYNGIASAQFEANEITANIKYVLEKFSSRKLSLMWWVGSRTYPQNIGKYLQQLQFTHNRDMIGMAAKLSDLQLNLHPDTNLTLDIVEKEAQLQEWILPFAESFNIPLDSINIDFELFRTISFLPESLWKHYIARDKSGKVVSVASLFLGAGVAGLYNVATPLHLRGFGYGTWITKSVLRNACEMGYNIATLQSTNPSALRLYSRLGFEIYNKTSIYQRRFIQT